MVLLTLPGTVLKVPCTTNASTGSRNKATIKLIFSKELPRLTLPHYITSGTSRDVHGITKTDSAITNLRPWFGQLKWENEQFVSAYIIMENIMVINAIIIEPNRHPGRFLRQLNNARQPPIF